MITILIFIAVLGLLIFVHEFGHFIMAKRAGMHVTEFAFGFPPRLIGIQKVNGKWKFLKAGDTPIGETTAYSINLIPLGGYVKIVGEDNNQEAIDPNSFTKKSFWARLSTLLAGVVMNVLLAFVLISIGFMIGLPTAVDNINDLPTGAMASNSRVMISEVEAGSPAAAAELKAGDTIVGLNEQAFSSVTGVQEYLKQQRGETVTFTIKRGGEEKNMSVQTRSAAEADKAAAGVGLLDVATVKFPFLQSIRYGAQQTYRQTAQIVIGLYELITKGAGLQNLGGPVKIAQLTGEVARNGFADLIQLTALLSLNLAVLNAIPFPALDGGRVLFLLIEKLRGKPNNQTFEAWANVIGFVLLLGLMAVITARDIMQII